MTATQAVTASAISLLALSPFGELEIARRSFLGTSLVARNLTRTTTRVTRTPQTSLLLRAHRLPRGARAHGTRSSDGRRPANQEPEVLDVGVDPPAPGC